MGWVKTHSAYTSLLNQHGLASAPAFLDWTGILVNRHRHRQVEQITLPGARFYLKKQHAVTWRERFRNAWHGLGWCATSVREARLLARLKDAGIGCPEVVAHGEADRQAFVLLRDEQDMTELRAFVLMLQPAEQVRLADALGHELARMHQAGFAHPDLFAKHILVKRDGMTFRFCFLDWQRGRQHATVSWRRRCRDLTVLDATLHQTLASDRLRLRCLRAYRQAAPVAPPLARLAQTIRRSAAALLRKRHIREIGQLPVPVADQQFVPACQGRLLVVRSHYDALAELPEAWTRNLEPEPTSTWEMPRLAHVLFRLQRFGVLAPSLVAVSRRAVHTEAPAVVPLADALRDAAGVLQARLWQQAHAIVQQIHLAGYRLPRGESWLRRLGLVMATQQVMLSVVEPLEECAKSPPAFDPPSLFVMPRERQAA